MNRAWQLMLGIGLLVAASVVLAQAPVATVDSVRFRNFGIASGLSQVTARAIVIRRQINFATDSDEILEQSFA